MSLTLEQAMQTLESLGSEQTRRSYRRHGAAEPLFGVLFRDLRPLAKRIGHDHALARELWATGNFDARLLACMVAEPRESTDAELDAWLEDVDQYTLVDVLVSDVAVAMPDRLSRAERWIASPRDRTAQAGWDLLNAVAMSDAEVPDAYFIGQLGLIAERIASYGNWTRRAASNAITGIGLRNEVLEAEARRTAARIGHVGFDPGQTSCTMPDPIAYLERTKAHRQAQAARRATRTR